MCTDGGLVNRRLLHCLLQRDAAEKVLKAFQEHPEAWTRVDSILEKASTQQTKYFALQVGLGREVYLHDALLFL